MPTSDRALRALVIGSGFGGIAAAIRLQTLGIQTTLIEQRDKPGGRAYVYEQDGFTFDAGPTVITAPETIEELFRIAGRRMKDYVELLPVEPFYSLFWEDGYRFDYTNNSKKLFEQISAKSPRDAEGYKGFLKHSEEVFAEGYTKLAHVPFLDWWSMMRVAPQLLRLRAFESVYSTVSRFIKDEQLRQAFSFHSLLVGGNPYTTSSIYTLIHYLERNWGVFFPCGGTGELVRGLIKLLTDLGGKVQLSCEVDEIAVQNGRAIGVKAKDGRFFAGDIVISNADVHATYNKLLRHVEEARSTARKLDRMSYSMSLFLIYFGTDRRYESLAHHNVIFGPRYKGLLDEIFHKGTLSDDFSLYLHAPTRTDPTLAPDGCEAFYVLSPVAHLGNLDIDWSIEAPRYGEKILKYLESRYLPGLTKSLRTIRTFTPQDFSTELGSHLGAAFSLEPRLTQSAYFRTHNRDAKIDGLYFVGAGTHPGAGIPGVINSAKATANLIATEFALDPAGSSHHDTSLTDAALA